MKYSQCREQIKTGDVLVCAGSWLMSRAIRWVSGQDVSHIGIAFWMRFNGESTKRLCMFEAMEGRDVRIIPLRQTLMRDYWRNGGKVWWQPTLEYDGSKILDFCIQHWGDGYANRYQFVLGMSRILRALHLWRTGSLDTDPKRWHCSELVANAFISQGYTPSKEPAICTPGDVSMFSCLGPRVLLEPDDEPGRKDS